MPPRNSLADQLKELEANQIITGDTARKIREYYNNKTGPDRSLPTVIAILGSISTASGITLVVAHNWDEF